MLINEIFMFESAGVGWVTTVTGTSLYYKLAHHLSEPTNEISKNLTFWQV